MAILTINKHYNFSVYANSVLGSNHTNANLTAILDYKTAIKFSNVELLHRQIYPYLPQGTLADNTKYTYYQFVVNNKSYIIADVWIIPSSVTETQGLNYTLTLNNITSTQLTTISEQLKLLGISYSIL